MNEQLRALVRRRANHQCEYCHLPQAGSGVEFEIDHIQARKHGGPTSDANLALSCVYCNGFKGTDLTGIDPSTGKVESLFNPRTHTWADHFRWSGVDLAGTTPVGRATIRTLKLNNPAAIQLRSALRDEGLMQFDS